MRCLPLLLVALTLPSLVLAEAKDNEALSYSLGVRLGERLRDEVPELQLQALLKGLQQAYRGEKLDLPAEQIEDLLAAHEARLASATDDSPAQQAERRFLAKEKAKPGTHELPGGVLWRELRAGQGPKPTADQQVSVRYSGRLADGTLFDESQEPQWFRLDSLIAGWRTALLAMPAGARWQLVIPSAQAYGAEGAGDLIPPHAPLVFEVELLKSR
ncbi:peptidylprolyl isomerase [Pseudomonas sp. HAR-UPW-AIA-41]|uniref:FKBP-type peptidyl-prolyl cis-trans isomerase n=1 Tax=Pseudomonas sp. HAR-UPW-AIA-41 TaxID=1985301 RepID=UPI000BB338A9|nr:FKBP-type peptidyl-prolyl cis-trans isomerase [Pseudomonas sp. HAR-UPW-AIA-41]PAV48332.1 peptidylprolyl isomerase [Pseudomonas sp. HAR-UPW-AIA-41]